MTGTSIRRARDRGSSAVEFSLVVAAMAAMIVAVVMGAGQVVKNMIGEGCGSIAAQVDSSGCSTPPQDTPGDTAAQDKPAAQSIDVGDPWVNDYGDVGSDV